MMDRIRIHSVLLQTFVLIVLISYSIANDNLSDSLVGRWNFDAGTGEDSSPNNNHAYLGNALVYDLGNDNYCMKVKTGDKPIKIDVDTNSNLAIKAGTIGFWINSSVVKNSNLIKYGNGAIILRSYRGYLQARFKGETDFNFSGTVLNDKWHEYVMREDAFYPHENALIEENVWHQFVVTYDYKNKQFIGWRDGRLIAVIDLSASDIEPLKTDELNHILIAEDFTGFIDDIRIYNKVFEQKDVLKLYNASKSIYDSRHDFIKPDSELNVYSYNETDIELYDAWLGNDTQNNAEFNSGDFSCIVVQGDNSTIHTAARELSDAINSLSNIDIQISTLPEKKGNIILGTPSESALIKELSAVLKLSEVVHDGYVLKTAEYKGNSCIIVAANEPAGIIYGTFALIKKIKLKQDLNKLDVISNPKVEIRIVGHWDWFRGFPSDGWHAKNINPNNWESNRYNSIFSWKDLHTGNTKLIRDWARLLASAGWNAICPTEINWQNQNNFLEHMEEVGILAGIFRKYGITLYWTPNYLLALDKATADTLYARVPDFGGYLLKLGSEGQLGNPFPVMVNQIASNLAEYGGKALVRGFVYGKKRYAHITDVYRNTMQYDIYVPNDGKYRKNVIIVGKANPLDWDLAAPISMLDGALRKTDYGTEMVVAKSWPASWVEKWKWWMDFDNFRNGPGSYNKNYIKCLLGVSMISPSPAWTSNPLNMVNYYGLGRLSWNPDLTLEQIYDEWIGLTYNHDPIVNKTIKEILSMSDDILRNLYMYRGYRGVWFDASEDDLVENKTPYIFNENGIGIINDDMQKKVLSQYAPGLRKIFSNPIKGEAFLPYFHFVSLDYMLSNDRTVIEDLYRNLDEAVNGSKQMLKLWESLEGKIDKVPYEYTRKNFEYYILTAEKQRKKMKQKIEEITGRILNR
jgi:alpha-glucuronidase